MKMIVLAAAALLLAACGGREALQPAPGHQMPIAPAMASHVPTTEELLTPPVMARPERVDEALRRSEVREEDRFDLPPS